MPSAHCTSIASTGIHAAFHLQKNASDLFRDFVFSDCTDHTVTVEPSDEDRCQCLRMAFRRCRVRWGGYTAGATAYGLATLLLDARPYRVGDLGKLDHGC